MKLQCGRPSEDGGRAPVAGMLPSSLRKSLYLEFLSAREVCLASEAFDATSC
jgi:hypothetical protein